MSIFWNPIHYYVGFVIGLIILFDYSFIVLELFWNVVIVLDKPFFKVIRTLQK